MSRTTLIALLLLVPAPAAQDSWTLTVFEPDGGGALASTACADVTDDGRVVGRTLVAGANAGFEWTVAEGFQLLPPNPFNSPGAGRVNTAGDMIIPWLSPAAVALADGSTPAILNPFGTTTSVAAVDIADGPVVVGLMAGTGNTSKIMIWEPATGSRSIFVPGASYLWRVSQGPWAVGDIQPVEGSSNGFVVNMDTEEYVTFNELLPGGAWSVASDVNDLGVVTGRVAFGTTLAAFTWSATAGFTFLPGLEGGPVDYVMPRAIDDAGRVVGQAFDANFDWRAFLWDPVSGMQDLNDVVDAAPFELIEARDISETGLIIGYGYVGPVWGPPRGWILQPPGPWADLGGALPGALGTTPRLVGEGSLLTNTWFKLGLHDAPPAAAGTWVVGHAAMNAPFKGGMLIPSPDLLLPFVTDGQGGARLDVPSWPLPHQGAALLFQAWMPQPGGFVASNGVSAQI